MPPPNTQTPASFASCTTACDASETACRSSSGKTMAALGNEIRTSSSRRFLLRATGTGLSSPMRLSWASDSVVPQRERPAQDPSSGRSPRHNRVEQGAEFSGVRPLGGIGCAKTAPRWRTSSRGNDLSAKTALDIVRPTEWATSRPACHGVVTGRDRQFGRQLPCKRRSPLVEGSKCDQRLAGFDPPIAGQSSPR